MFDITAGTVLADRYEIGEQLGVGGTGVVWQAHDNVLRRDVALKVVRDGEHERLEREARAAAGVNDRRVVAVYDAGQHHGTVFLVMELVHGVDLGQVVRVCGALSSDVTAMLGHDLARGLGAIHAAHIIHRDIKPSNVMLTREGDVKLGDLGIARTSDASSTVRLTETGTIVGTIDYLAPEQLDEHDVTTATDVYAVGLLLVECTTGQKPFGEGTLAERAARRLARSPEPPADIDPALRDAIVAAVHREPEDRPQSGYELADRLVDAYDDQRAARGELAELVARTLAAPLDQRRSASPRPLARPAGSVDVDTVAYTPTGVEVDAAELLPAAADGPVDGELAADEPPADAPAADERAADEPPADEPPADEPPADEPAADERAADEPAADQRAGEGDRAAGHGGQERVPVPVAAGESTPAGFQPDPRRLALEIGGLVLAILATVALSTAILG